MSRHLRRHEKLLRPVPVPDRIDPRTAVALNLIEEELAPHPYALRCFRLYWRQLVIDVSCDTAYSFRKTVRATLQGRSLYSYWWGPGLLHRRLVKALLQVEHAIDHVNLDEVFS